MPKTFPSWVNIRIKQIAIELRAKMGSLRYPNAAEIKHELHVRSWPSEYIPSGRHIQRVLSELDPVWISPIDSPWSLGVSNDHGIPSDATGVLMKVWRWSITDPAAEIMSTRTARWVARLRWVPEAGGTDQGGVGDAETLYVCASMYSGRERQVELIKNKTEKDKKGIRSGQLDAQIMLGEALAKFAAQIGILEEELDIDYSDAFSNVAPHYFAEFLRRQSDMSPAARRRDEALKTLMENLDPTVSNALNMAMKRLTIDLGTRKITEDQKHYCVNQLAEDLFSVVGQSDESWNPLPKIKELVESMNK